MNRITDYDGAECIDSTEYAAEYLSAAFEDGDPNVIRKALDNIARAKGMGKLAKSVGVGRQSLYKSLAENGNPQFETVLNLIQAMGLKVKVEAA